MMETLDVRTLITRENIQKIFAAKDYQFFDGNKPFNLNLIGVRRDHPQSNRFDDFIAVVYRDDGLRWQCQVWEATTDPGKYWLEHPTNPKGTAILIAGQYRSAWKLGLHQRKYEALYQQGAVKVWRDNDKNDVLDFECEVVDEGCFGINIHRSNPYTESFLVDKWSAGCQVFKKIEDYQQFIALCQRAAQTFGNSFTYTLLTEEDFRAI